MYILTVRTTCWNFLYVCTYMSLQGGVCLREKPEFLRYQELSVSRERAKSPPCKAIMSTLDSMYRGAMPPPR